MNYFYSRLAEILHYVTRDLVIIRHIFTPNQWLHGTLTNMFSTKNLVWILTLVLIATVLLEVFAGYFALLLSSKFYAAFSFNSTSQVSPKDQMTENFIQVLSTQVIWIIPLVVFAKSFTYLVKNLLQIYLRKLVNNNLSARYTSNLNFFKLKKCENPDQRICEDLNNFSKNFTNILKTFFQAVVEVGWYSYQTWISAGIGSMFLIYGFAGVGVLINMMVVPRQSKKATKVAECEGFYRNSQQRIKNYKESIALANSSQLEANLARQNFKILVNNMKIFTYLSSVLTFLSQFINYLGGILSYLIVAPNVINSNLDYEGQSSSEYVAKYTGIYMMLIFQFTTLIQQFPEFGQTYGLYVRLREFDAELQELEKSEKGKQKFNTKLYNQDIAVPETSSDSASSSNDLLPSRTSLIDDSLQVIAKDGLNNPNILIENFTVNFSEKRTLLKGRSGSGKTTIVKYLSGVYSTTDPKNLKSTENTERNSLKSDRLAFNSKKNLIIPQNYTQIILPNCNWQQQLAYPENNFENLPLSEINTILDFLGLPIQTGPSLTKNKQNWLRVTSG